MLENRCPTCRGTGEVYDWANGGFEREVDHIVDTQGISIYDAVLQLKRKKKYLEAIQKCNTCNGTGKTE